MTDCVHHWLLEAPEPEGTQGACLKCDDTRTWSRLRFEDINGGRPRVLTDPLMPRAFNNGYAGPRPRNDYY